MWRAQAEQQLQLGSLYTVTTGCPSARGFAIEAATPAVTSSVIAARRVGRWDFDIIRKLPLKSDRPKTVIRVQDAIGVQTAAYALMQIKAKRPLAGGGLECDW
jgi:hypothetical protein